jgi:sec-independent protein translocase protein TatA
MFGLDVPSHWIILAVLAIVFFGYKNLPDMSRSLGRSLRIFKSEMKDLTDEGTATSSSSAPEAAPRVVAVATESTPVTSAQR